MFSKNGTLKPMAKELHLIPQLQLKQIKQSTQFTKQMVLPLRLWMELYGHMSLQNMINH